MGSSDPNFRTPSLNLASYNASTQALGPGMRGVVWVQGCPLSCKGCIAPGWIPFKPALILTPQELLEKFDLDRLEGLTFSGGEPMEQAEGLTLFARLVRRKKSLNIICFTGYRYERLLQNPPNNNVHELLQELDVLIDGPYVQARNDSLGLRGSSNQRIIHLTSRLTNHDLESQPRKVEVSISNHEVVFVGIPTPGFQNAFEKAREASRERMNLQ